MRLLIAEEWDGFARRVLPPQAPAIQRKEMRRAFYAGCQTTLHTLMKALDAGTEATGQDLALMAGVEKELSDFADMVKNGRA